MRAQSKTALAALALALAQPPASAVLIEPARKDVERSSEFLRLYGALLYRKAQDCTGQNPCMVDVKVTVVPFEVTPGNKVDYCLAEVPVEITVGGTSPTAPAQRIVWRLIPKTLTAASGANYQVKFHDKNGIMLASNPGGQLSWGGYGDGSPGTPDTAWYFMRNKHRVMGTAIYLPVILQVNTAKPDEIGVCATGDPRIVNT